MKKVMTMKRFFRKRRSKHPEGDGAADKVVNRDDSIGVTAMENELAGFKMPPKKVSEPKQGAKKVTPARTFNPEPKAQGVVTDSKKQASGKGVDATKSCDEDKPVVSPTKSGSEGKTKKVNGSGTSPTSSPSMKQNVNEVVVPESSGQDRHSTISNAYDSIPLLEQTKLPRGGISIETKAVGMVQVRSRVI